MNLDIKFCDWLPKSFDRSILIPRKAHEDDAGYDLVAAESGTIYVGQKARIPCGIEIALPPGYEAQVRSRSGLAAKNSLFVINSPGTVDAGYRGEIVVMLFNLGGMPYQYSVGDRVAQLVIHEVPKFEVRVVDQLPASARGTSGFGSSGK